VLGWIGLDIVPLGGGFEVVSGGVLSLGDWVS